jgi:hypothetical protein
MTRGPPACPRVPPGGHPKLHGLSLPFSRDLDKLAATCRVKQNRKKKNSNQETPATAEHLTARGGRGPRGLGQTQARRPRHDSAVAACEPNSVGRGRAGERAGTYAVQTFLARSPPRFAAPSRNFPMPPTGYEYLRGNGCCGRAYRLCRAMPAGRARGRTTSLDGDRRCRRYKKDGERHRPNTQRV